MFAEIDDARGIEDARSKVGLVRSEASRLSRHHAIGYFVAKAIGRIFDGLLERVGFDRAVEGGGVTKALENSKYDASSILSKVVFSTLFLLVLQMAFGVFGANPVSDLITGIVAHLPTVFSAIMVVVIAVAVAAA